MASTSGFQAGAERVAKNHNMTLIHVTDASNIDLSMFGANWGPTIPAFHIKRVELEYSDGEKTALPEQSNAMEYYVGHVIIEEGSQRGSLAEVLQNQVQVLLQKGAEACENHVVDCEPDTRVIAPDDGEIPLKPLARIHFQAGMSTAQTLTGPVKFDPYLLLHDVNVRDVASGEERHFSQHGLALGIDTTFEESKFYEQPQLAMYYYCDRIEGEIATLYLVESFQNGQLVRCRLKVNTEHACRYVPVTEAATIQRLQRRLASYKAAVAVG